MGVRVKRNVKKRIEPEEKRSMLCHVSRWRPKTMVVVF